MLKRLLLAASLVVGLLATITPASAAQQFYDKTDVERSNTGTISGNGQCVSLTPLGNSGASIEVTGGATATLAVTEYLDAAQTPIAVPVVAESAPTTLLTSFSASANMIYDGVVSAKTNVSVCATAYTSGTATVTLRTGAPGLLYTLGGGGNGNQGTPNTLPNAWPFYFGPGGIPTNANVNTVTATTCTNLSASALAWGVALTNANASAQTVTITLYNDSATGCASANQRYSIQLGGGQTFVIPLPKSAWNSGLAYILSGAPAANVIVSWL